MNYSNFVQVLVKPGEDIIASLTPEKAHLLHMAVGVAGEGGELLDAMKRYVIYCKALDRENLVEELGDLEFYMQSIRDTVGITREEVLEYNMKKLSERYAKLTYSNEAAIERADKQ